MNETATKPQNHDDSGHYEVCVKGHLSDRGLSCFEGLTFRREASGNTILTAPDLDQAALPSVLKKVRDLGMRLLSVNYVQ